MESLFSMIGALLFFGVYFLPAYIASRRGHQSEWAILALNLCLGWTVLGWLLALIWGLSGTNRQAVEELLAAEVDDEPDCDPTTMECPRCAETIKKAAKICRFCGHELQPEPESYASTGSKAD